jgi:hypothetical protein
MEVCAEYLSSFCAKPKAESQNPGDESMCGIRNVISGISDCHSRTCSGNPGEQRKFGKPIVFLREAKGAVAESRRRRYVRNP